MLHGLGFTPQMMQKAGVWARGFQLPLERLSRSVVWSALGVALGVEPADAGSSTVQATKDMSGGWRMRVALAQALLPAAELLSKHVILRVLTNSLRDLQPSATAGPHSRAVLSPALDFGLFISGSSSRCC